MISIGSGGRISYEVGSLILVIATALYVAVGGLRAAYWTDVLQGIWMYLGVWLAGLLIMYKFFPGGLPEMFEAVREVKPELLTLNWRAQLLVGNIIVFGVGVMILPHLWIKFYAARDTRALKWTSALTALYLSSFYIPAMLVGLTAAVLNVKGAPGLEPGFIRDLTTKYGSADAVMAYMIYVFTHPVIAGLLLAGAAAAAMSTLDSFLGSISMILTRDIYQKINPRASESSLVWVSRALIILFGLVGWYLAILKPGLIFDIVAIAAGGGLQVLPALIQAVFLTRRVYINKYGALAGLIVGAALVLIMSVQTAKYFGTPAALRFPPGEASLYALIANVIVALVVTALTRGRS